MKLVEGILWAAIGVAVLFIFFVLWLGWITSG